MALGGGFLVPSPCRRIVLGHTPPVGIQLPKVVLRLRHTLGCRLLPPLRAFLLSWAHPPVGGQLPELVLRPPVALGGGFLVPFPCGRIVLRHAPRPLAYSCPSWFCADVLPWAASRHQLLQVYSEIVSAGDARGTPSGLRHLSLHDLKAIQSFLLGVCRWRTPRKCRLFIRLSRCVGHIIQ